MDDAFWLRYLRAHADPRTRTLHAMGTLAATTLMTLAAVRRDPRLAGAALVAGYGPAWFAHAFIERNKPETFSAPLRSLAGDYVMCWKMLTGTIGPELERAQAGTAMPSSAAS
ncbi:MAG TPA: DUF962 domain-containing protein [Candidatus Elarobacter sp.]|jgi:hypothetical protein